MAEQRKVIDEANYKAPVAKEKGPAAIGEGGDPLFKNVNATKEQLQELLEETSIIQDWLQKETCNNIAKAYLANENLKDIYYEIKDGFGEYGPMLLMGFKTPQGVEIPRLKLMDKEGNVIQVLSGPSVFDEINKRANVYRESIQDYVPIVEAVIQEELTQEIVEYSGNAQDYI